MIKEAIMKLAKKENLTFEETELVMNEIMGGEATGVQMSSYLTALSMKAVSYTHLDYLFPLQNSEKIQQHCSSGR